MPPRRRLNMDSIRQLTETINVFVQFFQSINCLFWQLRWLESNVTEEQGGRAGLVLVILAFAVYYTFGCNSSSDVDGCKDWVVQIGIISILALVAAYLLYKRYLLSRRGSEAQIITANMVVDGSDEHDKLITPSMVTPTAPAYVVNDIEMVRSPSHLNRRN